MVHCQEWTFGTEGFLASSPQRSKRQINEAATKMAAIFASSSAVTSSSESSEARLKRLFFQKFLERLSLVCVFFYLQSFT
jgi:hypothetical protein